MAIGVLKAVTNLLLAEKMRIAGSGLAGILSPLTGLAGGNRFPDKNESEYIQSGGDTSGLQPGLRESG